MMSKNGQAIAKRSRAITDFDGDKLRHWRQEIRMLSQVELGNAAGLSRGEISHLETRKRRPLATTLRRLCIALECEPADLLTVLPAEAKDNHAATQEPVSV